MWYIRNVLADFVNLIWFDLLGRRERLKAPLSLGFSPFSRHWHPPSAPCNPSCIVKYEP